MRAAVRFKAGPFLAGLLIALGCSDNSVQPESQAGGDEAAITAALAAAPEFLDDGLLEASDQVLLAPSLRDPNAAPGSASAAIEPHFFWRRITGREQHFTFAFADSDTAGRPATAVVTLHRRYTGTFNIVPRDPSEPGSTDTLNVIRKPLEDHWVRHFLMKRVRLGQEVRPIWRLAAASGVEVTSKEATSLISSIRIRTASLDTTLTDPLEFIRLRHVLRFGADEMVTLTVTTPRSDDVVLLYHHDRRERLHNNGDGTYSGTFRSGFWNGWRHFAVNALSHGTLFDDTAPYDSKAWIFPYVIVSGPFVDYLP